MTASLVEIFQVVSENGDVLQVQRGGQGLVLRVNGGGGKFRLSWADARLLGEHLLAESATGMEPIALTAECPRCKALAGNKHRLNCPVADIPVKP